MELSPIAASSSRETTPKDRKLTAVSRKNTETNPRKVDRETSLRWRARFE